MMGYQTSFMQLSCINLLASKNYTEKRMAYSALSLIMDETSKVLLLATATIKRDLNSEDNIGICLALNAIGDICTPDMCRELSYEVVHLIKTTDDPNIKKKAGCAASYIIKKCPDLIELFAEIISYLLEDKTHSVCLSGIVFALELLKIDPTLILKIKKYHSMFVKYEKALLSISYSPEFDVNGITDPFLQARIIEIMKYTAKGSKVLSDELGDLFVSVQSITEASKQTGYAIQYEIVKTINNLEANAGMKSLSNNILGKFLSSKDLNLKYISLNTLKDVARYDLSAVQKHRVLILDFLKEQDISLQRRALDLIYLIINESNIKQISKECLAFLSTTTDELKTELTNKLTISLNQYSPNFKWQIDTLIKMVSLSGNCIYEDTLSSIINLFVSITELHVYIGHKLILSLRNNIDNESLAKIAIYFIGEYPDVITNNPLIGGDNQQIIVSINDIMKLMNECKMKNIKKSTVQEYLLNCYLKLGIKFPNVIQQVKDYFEEAKTSYYPEVEQRAIEYGVFNDIVEKQLKIDVTKIIPLPKNIENDIKKKELLPQREEDDEDKDILLNSITLLNKEISGNSTFSIPSNLNDIINTIELKPDKAESNIMADLMPTNPPSTSTAGDLFDLNNIFSSVNNTQPIGSSSNAMPFYQATTPIIPGVTNEIDFNLPIQQPQLTNKPIETSIQEAFNDKIIFITYSIQSQDQLNFNGCVYASNDSDNIIDNIKINFMIQKFVTLKVLNTSGNTLEPKQSLGVKKDFTLTTNDKNKKIVLRLKLSYQMKGQEYNHVISIDDIRS